MNNTETKRWEREDLVLLKKRGGATRVALKCLKNSQNMEYVNSIERNSLLPILSVTLANISFDAMESQKTLKPMKLWTESLFTWDMFLHILIQIAGGLRFIHDSKLVHGDIHPINILVLKTNPLKVVISDLGFCRPADHSTRSGDIFGVVQYLAPEGERPVIKKHTPQCIQEMIEKNWDENPYCRDSAEQF
ncbi:hypothetical protein G9A89_005019 [Geosiphon pyriformis]|nr:hypothetical protein G9A89_005019 [Geosiphon pyriformis]